MLDRAADPHQLLARRAEPFHAPIRVQREVVLFDQPRGLLGHARAGSPNRTASRSSRPRKMFSATERCGARQRLLVDHGDAGRGSFRGRTEAGHTAPPQHLPAVAALHSRDDLHQRGFARAILAQQQVYFAGIHREISIAQGRHTAEPFLNATESEKHRTHSVSYGRGMRGAL